MKNKYDYLIIAGFTSGLFYSMSYPIIHLECMKDISSNLMSLSQLLSCILTVVITQVWLKKSEVMYLKTFKISLIAEVLLYGSILCMLFFNVFTPTAFYISDCILCSTITRNIINGGTRLKAIRYKGEQREIFDNKNMMLCNVASMVGYFISTIFVLPRFIAVLFMFLGLAIDNLFYLYAYHETNKNYKETDA
jgi:hypothetical protein